MILSIPGAFRFFIFLIDCSIYSRKMGGKSTSTGGPGISSIAMGWWVNAVLSLVFFSAFQGIYLVCVGVSFFVFNGVYRFPRFSLEFPNCSDEVVAVVFMV